jgi:hypothetical protein
MKSNQDKVEITLTGSKKLRKMVVDKIFDLLFGPDGLPDIDGHDFNLNVTTTLEPSDEAEV